jgi:26S proteasome regulatory subunit N8
LVFSASWLAVKEKLLGFYSTGPDIKAADLGLDSLLRTKGVSNPLMVIVDIRPEVDEGLPVQAYLTKEIVSVGKHSERQFEHIPTEIGASESEEVAVEHLLREVNDPSISELGAALSAKVHGLRGLESRLRDIADYLDDVAAGKLPLNREIVSNVQTMLALLPNLGVAELSQSLQRQTNDMHLAMMIAALVRSVIGIHDLASNRLKYRHLDAAGEMIDVEEEPVAPPAASSSSSSSSSSSDATD